jgi:hypothetical protein
MANSLKAGKEFEQFRFMLRALAEVGGHRITKGRAVFLKQGRQTVEPQAADSQRGRGITARSGLNPAEGDCQGRGIGYRGGVLGHFIGLGCGHIFSLRAHSRRG